VRHYDFTEYIFRLLGRHHQLLFQWNYLKDTENFMAETMRFPQKKFFQERRVGKIA